MWVALRFVWGALAVVSLAVPFLALHKHTYAQLYYHGDGTEFILWALLVLLASSVAPAVVIGWWFRSVPRVSLFLAAAQALILCAQLYTSAYLDACMLRVETTNPQFLSPSTW